MCDDIYTLNMFLWLVVSLHTGQTLICAMGKAAALLRVKCGSSGYFLCADGNISFTLSEERGSDRSRTIALRQDTYDHDMIKLEY